MIWSKELQFVVEEKIREIKYNKYENDSGEFIHHDTVRIIFFEKEWCGGIETIRNIMEFNIAECFKKDFTLKKYYTDLLMVAINSSCNYAIEGVRQ